MKKLLSVFLLILSFVLSSCTHEHNYITTKKQFIKTESTSYYLREDKENNTLIVPSFRIDSCTICHKVDTVYIPYDLYYCPSAPYHSHSYEMSIIGSGYVIERCKWCDLSRRNHFSDEFEYENPFNIDRGLSLHIKIRQ